MIDFSKGGRFFSTYNAFSAVGGGAFSHFMTLTLNLNSDITYLKVRKLSVSAECQETVSTKFLNQNEFMWNLTFFSGASTSDSSNILIPRSIAIPSISIEQRNLYVSYQRPEINVDYPLKNNPLGITIFCLSRFNNAVAVGGATTSFNISIEGLYL